MEGTKKKTKFPKVTIKSGEWGYSYREVVQGESKGEEIGITVYEGTNSSVIIGRLRYRSINQNIGQFCIQFLGCKDDWLQDKIYFHVPAKNLDFHAAVRGSDIEMLNEMRMGGDKNVWSLKISNGYGLSGSAGDFYGAKIVPTWFKHSNKKNEWCTAVVRLDTHPKAKRFSEELVKCVKDACLQPTIKTQAAPVRDGK